MVHGHSLGSEPARVAIVHKRTNTDDNNRICTLVCVCWSASTCCGVSSTLRLVDSPVIKNHINTRILMWIYTYGEFLEKHASV